MAELNFTRYANDAKLYVAFTLLFFAFLLNGFSFLFPHRGHSREIIHLNCTTASTPEVGKGNALASIRLGSQRTK